MEGNQERYSRNTGGIQPFTLGWKCLSKEPAGRQNLFCPSSQQLAVYHPSPRPLEITSSLPAEGSYLTCSPLYCGIHKGFPTLRDDFRDKHQAAMQRGRNNLFHPLFPQDFPLDSILCKEADASRQINRHKSN